MRTLCVNYDLVYIALLYTVRPRNVANICQTTRCHSAEVLSPFTRHCCSEFCGSEGALNMSKAPCCTFNLGIIMPLCFGVYFYIQTKISNKNMSAVTYFGRFNGHVQVNEQFTLWRKYINTNIYRVSQEEWTKLRKSVPYVELYRYNPKHLYPKLNGYGDNDQRSLKL